MLDFIRWYMLHLVDQGINLDLLDGRAVLCDFIEFSGEDPCQVPELAAFLNARLVVITDAGRRECLTSSGG